MTKKQYEVACCQFLVESIFASKGIKLRVEANSEQNSDVDAFGMSDIKVFKFQVVTSDGKLSELSHRNAVSHTKGGLVYGIKEDNRNWILAALKKKERAYPDDVKRSLILVIDGGITLGIDEARSLQIPSSNFLGVYLVRMPTVHYPDCIEGRGFVISLKSV